MVQKTTTRGGNNTDKTGWGSYRGLNVVQTRRKLLEHKQGCKKHEGRKYEGHKGGKNTKAGSGRHELDGRINLPK